MQRGSQPRHRDGGSLFRDRSNFASSASTLVRHMCGVRTVSLGVRLRGAMLSFLRCKSRNEEVAGVPSALGLLAVVR